MSESTRLADEEALVAWDRYFPTFQRIYDGKPCIDKALNDTGSDRDDVIFFWMVQVIYKRWLKNYYVFNAITMPWVVILWGVYFTRLFYLSSSDNDAFPRRWCLQFYGVILNVFLLIGLTFVIIRVCYRCTRTVVDPETQTTDTCYRIHSLFQLVSWTVFLAGCEIGLHSVSVYILITLSPFLDDPRTLRICLIGVLLFRSLVNGFWITSMSYYQHSYYRHLYVYNCSTGH
jgi:hypothetical protein